MANAAKGAATTVLSAFMPHDQAQSITDSIGKTVEQGVKVLSPYAGAISTALDFVPIVGQVKMLAEATTGIDLITGEHLEGWQRLLNVGLVALPLVSGVIKLAAGESEAASKLIGKEVSSEEKAAAKEVKADGGFGIADPNADAAPHEVSTDSNSGGGGENVPTENVSSSGSGDNGAVCANSFSANTPVETNNNGSTKTISNVQLGDQVLAYNQDTGATATYTVTNVLVHLDPVLVDLTVDGETVETTPEHPFYIEQYGWLDAGLLWQGAQVRKADGSDGIVQAVKVVQRQQVMYNLTVADAHTFFVGDKHFLVHNVSACQKPGGYQTFDTGSYEDLSLNSNRAPGYTNSKIDGFIQAHHPIQDQWARANITGYESKAAPAILLPSYSGAAHAQISAAQRIARYQRLVQGLPVWTSTTIREEFNFGYRILVDASIPEEVARKVIRKTYKYFDALGAFQ